MDMWFMRMFGRISGGLYKPNPEGVRRSLVTLREELIRSRAKDPSELVFQTQNPLIKELNLTRPGVIEKLTEEQVLALARVFDMRFRKDDFKMKTNLSVSSRRVVMRVKRQVVETPRSGGDRNRMRAIIQRAIDLHERATGERLTLAEAQSVLWYPEQELYRRLGYRGTLADSDYASALRLYAKKHGYTLPPHP